jgi:predicted nucleic acid-binding protein
VQVLQELCVNLIRKTVSQSEARQTISDYCAWHVVDNDPTLLVEGIDLQIRWQSSFWDALILAAARRVGAGVIWSEDLAPTQDYGGIVAVNPLIWVTTHRKIQAHGQTSAPAPARRRR